MTTTKKRKRIELSLCKNCHCMTWTIAIKGLSASENEHFRYECGKCGFQKDIGLDLKRFKNAKNKTY